MRLEEIQEMIDRDSRLDETRLDDEALKIPSLHSRYYRIFIEEYQRMKVYQTEADVLKKELTEYYLGVAPEEVYKARPLNRKVMRQDLDLYLNADGKLNLLRLKVENQHMKVDLLEAFIKTLSNRNFLIKSAIDWRRFQSGS